MYMPQPVAGNPPIPSWKLEFRQLAPSVYAYIQSGGPGVDNAGLSSAGVIVGTDSMLAIDSLAVPIHTKAFIATATKAIGKRFDRLVNTHHHGDHTAGNGFFLPAEVVAHPYCREMVLKAGVPNISARPQAWQIDAHELKLAPPVTTFEGRMTYYYGDTVVELMAFAPAHTYGDVLVYLPQHRILFTGDVASFYVSPVSAGHTSKWIDLLDQIDDMEVETIVPGHGPIGTKRELAEFRQYLSLIRSEARKRFDAGTSPGRAAAEIDLGRFESWPNRERTVGTVVRLYAEFDNTIGPELDPKVMRQATDEYNALRR
jgi:cyclase